MTTNNHRIERFLDEHHVPYEVVAHLRTATSLRTADAAGVPSDRLAKAVLLEGDDCHMAAMIPADRDVRLGQLRQDYGEHLRLADEAAVRRLFDDCDPGAMPGLPSAWGVETVWDDELLAHTDIYLEAGDHEHLIHVTTRHLRQAMEDMPHCHFCGPKRPH